MIPWNPNLYEFKNSDPYKNSIDNEIDLNLIIIIKVIVERKLPFLCHYQQLVVTLIINQLINLNLNLISHEIKLILIQINMIYPL